MQICCDVCGGELVMMAGGKGAVCKTCGMEHSIARVREMLNVPVQAPDRGEVIPQGKKRPEKANKTPEPDRRKDTSAKSDDPIDVEYEVDAPKPVKAVLTESKDSDFVLKKCFGGAKLKAYNGNAQRVIVPACIDEIPGPQFFAGHNEIVELVFPGGLNTPYGACFANCRNLKKVTIMGSVTLMDETFAGCTALEEVEIINVESIESPVILGDRAFADCTSLKSFFVDPNGGLELGAGCFENCTALTVFRYTPKIGGFSGELNIPHACFKNCKNLQKVIVADDLEEIETAAFENCVKLRQIVYHDGTVPTALQIHAGAFNNAGCKL